MFVQVCLHYKQHFRLSTYFRSSCSYGLWLFYFLPLLSLSLPRLNSAKLQLWFYLTDAFKKDQKQLDDSSIDILEEFITFSLCFLFYICFFFFFDFFFTTPISQSLFMTVFFRTLVGVSASTVAHSSGPGRRQSLGILYCISYLIVLP